MPHETFHCTTYDYPCTDWDDVLDHWRDIPSEVTFKRGTPAAATEFSGQASFISLVSGCLHAAAIAHRNDFFHLYQQNKSFASEVKFRDASNCGKKAFEAGKLAYANKTKDYHLPETWLCNIWQIANSVPNKGKCAILPLFSGPRMLSAASDKAKIFDKSFSRNLRLDESCICLPAFPSVNNLKLHNRLVTPKFATKIITNFDSSKGSGPDSGSEEL